MWILDRSRLGSLSAAAGWLVLNWAVLLLLFMNVSVPGRSRADAPEREFAARGLFEQGLAKAEEGEWQQAAILLEKSRTLVERPATVMNLILVYKQLEQPLAIVRMVQRLLAVTDPIRHVQERQRALELEAFAYERLGRAVLSGAPADAMITIDGTAPVMANSNVMLLEPGAHELVISAPGYLPEFRKLNAAAGSSSELRVNLTRMTDPPQLLGMALAPVNRAPRREQQADQRLDGSLAAISMSGAAVWLGAMAAELVAYHRALALARQTPTERGFLTVGEEYARARRAVVPLAWTGGVVMLAGVIPQIWRKRERRPSWSSWAGVGLSIAMLGSGIALSAVEPDAIGRSTLPEPTREAGLMLVAGALPLGLWCWQSAWR